MSYYRELLGLPSESKRARKLSIIDDATDLGGPGSHIKHVDIPAIEDGPAPEPEEGEPDDEDPPATSSRSSLPGSTLDKSQTFSWGGFPIHEAARSAKEGAWTELDLQMCFP